MELTKKRKIKETEVEDEEEEEEEKVDAHIEMENKPKEDKPMKKEQQSIPAISKPTPTPSEPTGKFTTPKVPYPNRLKSHKDAVNYAKFLEVFKKLHINIPFADALAQMPSYVKFLKDILSNKRKIEEHATVALTEECSAIIQNKLPQKLKDPGSFTIPVHIGDIELGKALCDLGASINLMPLSIFRRLGLGEVQPTSVILQLADRSIKFPYGLIEDVLVKVENFYFPADFIVLDMDEDKEVPLILGRPFLATARALIDVEGGKLTLRVGEEKAVFDVFRATKSSLENDTCYRIDTLETVVSRASDRESSGDELVDALNGIDSEIATESVMQLNALPVYKKAFRPVIESLGDPLPKSQPSSEVSPKLELKQ